MADVPHNAAQLAALAEAAVLSGATHAQRGLFQEAWADFQRALRFHPDNVDAHHNLAILLIRQRQHAEAAAHYQQVLRIKPDHVEAHYGLGYALHVQGNLEDASLCYLQALRLKPHHLEARNNLGGALIDQRRWEEAAACYLELLRSQPLHAVARSNLGIALMELGRWEEATACYEQALREDPNIVEAHNGLGIVLAKQSRFAEALARYEQALRLDPRDADSHLNRALMWLLNGDWARGWPEYEWRLQTRGFPRFDFRQPRWDGTPLRGRTLLVLAEQGLGDTLQFIRYVPLVRERGGRVLVQCQPAVRRLLADFLGLEHVVVRGEPVPAFDTYAPLLSLPGILGTTVATIPGGGPYLQADAELAEKWRRNLEPLRGLKVGIAWQGNPKARGDRQRSIPLRHFGRLATIAGIHLISLQTGRGAEQLRDAASRFPVLDVASRFDTTALADATAVIKNVDLVISVDTAVAHLAGALGVAVWVALPTMPDWRWLLQREDSPWYPTMRLFRQTRVGQWEDVFERMAEELRYTGTQVHGHSGTQ